MDTFPFDSSAETARDPVQSKALRVKLRNGELPIAFNSGDKPLTEVSIVRECLQNDPFLRPTASSLSQQLFNHLVLTASQHGLVNQTIETQQHFMGKLEEQILANAEKQRSKDSHIVPDKLTMTNFQPLVDAVDSNNPSLAFVVGMAYLYDLVNVEEDQISSQTSRESPAGK